MRVSSTSASWPPAGKWLVRVQGDMLKLTAVQVPRYEVSGPGYSLHRTRVWVLGTLGNARERGLGASESSFTIDP